MRMVSTALLALVLALPSLASAQAAARPDFSGSWTFDPAQSDQGQMVPQKLSQTITQTANGLVVDRTQTNQMGEVKATLKYSLDGSPSVNELNFGGNAVQVTTVVSWDGSSPVFTNTLKFGDNEIKQVDRWTLADGGKKLEVLRTFNRDGQETRTKLVLVKG